MLGVEAERRLETAALVGLNAPDPLICFVAPAGWAVCATAPETVDEQPLVRVHGTDAPTAGGSRQRLIQRAQRYSVVSLKTFAPDPRLARLSMGVDDQDLCQRTSASSVL